jgi:PAS domain S-box-containing protein
MSMPQTDKTRDQLTEENRRLKAQVAQLEDRLDHVIKKGEADGESNKQALALADLEQLHKVTLAEMSDVVLITDDNGRLSYVSPNVQVLFGHSYDDLLQQGRIGFMLPTDLFDPDVLERRGEITNISCRIRDSIGRARDLLVNVKRVQLPEGTILYTCRDVTERLQIEMELELLKISLDRKVDERTLELRDSRERYRRLVEGLRDEYCFYSNDPNGVITYVSPSVHNILGYTADQCIGHNWREFVDPNSRTYAHTEELERQRAAGLPTPPFESEVLHANGKTVLLEVRDVQIHDLEGNFILAEGICKDITAQRESELALHRAHENAEQLAQQRTAELREAYEQLRESEQRYRNVVEDNPDFIVRWRGHGERTFVNDAYCRYLNEDRETLVGTSFMDAILEEDRQTLEERLRSVTKDSPLVMHDHRVTLSDGRVAWHRWSHRALFDSDGQLVEFQSVGSDITNRHADEEHARDVAVAEAKVSGLTPREQDVMRRVVAGDANKVIARKLDLSIKTIEKHRSSLMRKLRVRSVPELVRLAMLAEPDGGLE